MQALLSPQANSIKPDLFTKCRSPSLRNQRSPSGRNKRIPSMQEHLCFSNHILRSSKQQSPSKISQQIKRRRSQLVENNQLSTSNPKKKQKSVVNNNAQNIMSSIQDLKQEYRILKQAYKQLIQEKMKNQQEMIQTKMENNTLKNKVEEHNKQQQQYKFEINQLKQQLNYSRLQLEREKKKNRDLENDLYFFRETDKSKTDHLALSSNNNLLKGQPLAFDKFKFTDSKDIFTQNPLIEQMNSNTANDSHLLSFSLTSVIDESIRMEQFSRRRKQHIKVVSDLSQATGLNDHFGNIEVKCKKQCMTSFKKNKKQSKFDFINDSKQNLINQSKQNLAPLSQLLNLKSPVSNDKKNIKLPNNSSTTRRRRQDKQNMQMPKNMKKKSKKVLQIGGNQ